MFPGSLDLIGDVHGCYDELCLLLERPTYFAHSSSTATVIARMPVLMEGSGAI